MFRSYKIQRIIFKTYSIIKNWKISILLLSLIAIISFFINNIEWRIIVLLLCVIFVLILRFFITQIIESIFKNQTNGLLLYKIDRTWKIRYDEQNKKFYWFIEIVQHIKNIGDNIIDYIPPIGFTSKYQHKEVEFKVYQVTDDQKRFELASKTFNLTAMQFLFANKQNRVYVIRKYISLKKVLIPKSETTIIAEIKYTHAKNLLVEQGKIGTISRFPRIFDTIKLEVEHPLIIADYNYNIYNPLGYSDGKLLLNCKKPELDGNNNRTILWKIVNAIPDYDYNLNFLLSLPK